jgi:hypothetical protein
MLFIYLNAPVEDTGKTQGGAKDILSYLYFYRNKKIIKSNAKFTKVLSKLIDYRHIQDNAIL